MFSSLVVFWWACSLVQTSSGLIHGTIHVNEGQPGERRTEPSLFAAIGKSEPNRPDSTLFHAGSMEELFMIDTESYNEDSSQDLTDAVQLQSRAMRSPPRRCIPQNQSCLGHQLPCCDPCDTCYCRFFNAICYCRRVGHTCAHRRT